MPPPNLPIRRSVEMKIFHDNFAVICFTSFELHFILLASISSFLFLVEMITEKKN